MDLAVLALAGTGCLAVYVGALACLSVAMSKSPLVAIEKSPLMAR